MHKKYFIVFVLIISCVAKISAASFYSGSLEEVTTPFPGVRHSSNIQFYSASAEYVSGELTFIYPTGLFTQTPNVIITLQSTGFPSSLLSATITANSIISATVMVSSFSVVGQNLTGAVTVHMWAVGV